MLFTTRGERLSRARKTSSNRGLITLVTALILNVGYLFQADTLPNNLHAWGKCENEHDDGIQDVPKTAVLRLL